MGRECVGGCGVSVRGRVWGECVWAGLVRVCVGGDGASVCGRVWGECVWAGVGRVCVAGMGVREGRAPPMNEEGGGAWRERGRTATRRRPYAGAHSHRSLGLVVAR